MKYVKGIAGGAVLILLDQLTKLWAVSALKDQEPISIINGVFKLQYLENTGVAFGFFQGSIVFVVIMTIAVVGLIVFFYGKIPDSRKYLPFRLTSVMLLSGAVGNLIDRIFHNYVVDFLYFELIDFPVFNIADCYVVASAIAIFFLFYHYKEEDLEFLSFKRKKR